MTRDRRKIGFLERWIWYHIAGFVLAVLLILAIDPIDEALGLDMGKLPVGMGMALGIGILEWAMLRKYGVGSAWILFLVIGFSLSFLLLDLVLVRSFPGTSDVLMILAVSGGAFIAALLQYVFILRRFPGAKPVWVVWYSLAWTLATLASMSVSFVPQLGIKGFAALLIAVGLILSGAPILAWISSGHLRSIFERVPELPDAEVGTDLI